MNVPSHGRIRRSSQITAMREQRKGITEEEMVRQRLRKRFPNTRMHVERRRALSGYVERTATRVAHGTLKEKPKLYVWKPAECTARQRTPRWAGKGIQTYVYDPDKEEKSRSNMKSTIIMMPETVYERPEARDTVYVHELVEAIRSTKNDTHQRGHRYALQAEKPFYKKYDTTRKEIVTNEVKDFNREYTCKHPHKKRIDTRENNYY